jgi:hypothetical protein
VVAATDRCSVAMYFSDAPQRSTRLVIVPATGDNASRASMAPPCCPAGNPTVELSIEIVRLGDRYPPSENFSRRLAKPYFTRPGACITIATIADGASVLISITPQQPQFPPADREAHMRQQPVADDHHRPDGDGPEELLYSVQALPRILCCCCPGSSGEFRRRDLSHRASTQTEKSKHVRWSLF